MKTGAVIHNFKITKSTRLPEKQAALWEMEHAVSGARLCWLETQDENKTFAISFKTIPQDSTGVFHILEHSVLCGSRKYPVKKPVVELLKTSLQTFLNAFTFPDKTIYPLSSVNNKDFLNLISVYMDAVFHPSLLTTPDIFRQEGWHYEFDKENGTPSFQGVVLNEMKGMCASPVFALECAMNRRLFPDNCYRYNSGGSPQHITELTYSQFCRAHETYYTPSNARILLAGKVELEQVLMLLDKCLPSPAVRRDDFEIPLQKPVLSPNEEIPYAIGKEELRAGRTIFSAGYVIGTFRERKHILGASVLADYLAGSDQGPLKRAVLERGLGQDVRVSVHDGIQQPWISCEVWNTDPEKIPELKGVMSETLHALSEKGLEKSLLSACLQQTAFRLHDEDAGSFPKGINEVLSILDSWNYGGEPCQNLIYGHTLKALEEGIDGGFFEDLLRALFLDNPHAAQITLVPSPSLEEKLQRQETKTAADRAASWSKDMRHAFRRETDLLRQWQESPDSKEDIKSLPCLRLEDADPSPRRYEMDLGTEDGVLVLRHKTESSLTYLTVYFNASFLQPEELPQAALLCRMLGRFPTAGHTAAQLQMLIREHIGELSFWPEVFEQKDSSKCGVYLAARCVCLKEREEEAVALLAEILTESKFEDTALLKELLEQTAMEMQMYILSQGNLFGILRADAYQTCSGAARERLCGLSFSRWIQEQLSCADTACVPLLSGIGRLYTRLITARRMTVSISSDRSLPMARRLIHAVPPGNDSETSLLSSCRPLGFRQEGLIIPSSVGFAVQASNIKNHGGSYSGSLCVLANVLSYNYLWNEIRVLGGAYGAGFTARSDGGIFFYTYRDPNPARSLNRFEKAGEFLRGFCCAVQDPDRMILGALSASDPVLSTRAQLTLMESRYFKGISYEDVKHIRQDLLSTGKKELLNFCGTLENMKKEQNICVVAGESMLRQCSQLQAGEIFSV